MKTGPLLALGVIIVSAAAAFAQQPPVNQVPIRVGWQQNPPSNVAFDDPQTGRTPFQPKQNHFLGSRQARGVFADHRVALAYGNYEVILPLRTQLGSPSLNLEIDGPSAPGCRDEVADALEAVPERGTDPVRLRAMVLAQQVLARTGATCPLPARRRFARAYFRMNCALARDVEFMRVSEEAVELLRVNPDKPPSAIAQDIANCRREAREGGIRAMIAAADQSFEAGDIETSLAFSSELVNAAADPEAEAMLANLRVTEDQLRGRFVRGLYHRQLELFRLDNVAAALDANQQLSELSADNDYAGAFRNARIDTQRLAHDREYLTSQMAPQ
jgi:hypothetical protein